MLRAASREEKVEAMRRSLRMMRATGTAACIEFREGGVEGVEAIRAFFDGDTIRVGVEEGAQPQVEILDVLLGPCDFGVDPSERWGGHV